MKARVAIGRLSAGLGLALALATPATAGAGWSRPVAARLNQNFSNSSPSPSFASVDGVPYVSWVESDGTNREVRVARLSAAGSWEQPWTGESATYGGINQSSTKNAFDASMASVGGVPYVTWSENDGSNTEIRVARLDTATNTWVQPGTFDDGVHLFRQPADDTHGAVNTSASENGSDPQITGVGGVPYVAWIEHDSVDPNSDIRVARLQMTPQLQLFWAQPWSVDDQNGGINQLHTHTASDPALTSAAGVPYVAWVEADGTGDQEVRVASLTAPGGTNFDHLPEPPSPTSGGISTGNGNQRPGIAVVGGTPYVCWEDFGKVSVSRYGSLWTPIDPLADSGSGECSLANIGGELWGAWSEASPSGGSRLNVARLDGSAHWVEPVSTTLNVAGGGLAYSDVLGDSAGVPYVVWAEQPPPGPAVWVEAARLEPEFATSTAVPSATGATLVTAARTFGIPYTVGFDYGTAFGTDSATQTTPAGQDLVSVSTQVDGLTPSTAYQFRPFALAGSAAPRVLGPAASFTTADAPPGDTTPGDTTPPALTLGGPKKQPLKHSVVVTATCANEGCSLAGTGSGTASAGKPKAAHRFKLAPVAASGAQGVAVKLKLKLSKRAFRTASAALSHGGHARVTVSVSATDLAGNATSAKRRIRLISRGR